jgi:hypothetical protein
MRSVSDVQAKYSRIAKYFIFICCFLSLAGEITYLNSHFERKKTARRLSFAVVLPTKSEFLALNALDDNTDDRLAHTLNAGHAIRPIERL